ncbi:MAG: zinc-dependent metalloprotease [Actinomycetota bacterium]
MDGLMEDPFDLPPDVLKRVPLFAEISKVLAWSGGPVNWDLARQIAVSVAAGESPAAAVTEQDHAEVAEHVRIAELWLTETIAMPTPSALTKARAATPADWAEHATKSFAELVDPVAAKVARAMNEQGGTALPEGGPDAGMIAQALGPLAPMFMGIQAGTTLGSLAREVTGTHETGLPTTDDELLLVLPTIDAFSAEYALDARATRQWIAARAATHRLVFEAFPDVRGQFFARYHNYVASLDIDLAQGLRRLQELDLSDPQRLQEILGEESLFSHQSSPETAKAASDVTTLLAVVEAFTAEAVAAVAARAGDHGRIAEAYARRIADGGSGRKMLASFIGLEPSDNQRAAEAFIRTVSERSGWATALKMFEDAGAFPTDAELADPETWLRRVSP